MVCFGGPHRNQLVLSQGLAGSDGLSIGLNGCACWPDFLLPASCSGVAVPGA